MCVTMFEGRHCSSGFTRMVPEPTSRKAGFPWESFGSTQSLQAYHQLALRAGMNSVSLLLLLMLMLMLLLLMLLLLMLLLLLLLMLQDVRLAPPLVVIQESQDRCHCGRWIPSASAAWGVCPTTSCRLRLWCRRE